MLGALAAHAPESYFVRILEATQELANEGQSALVLGALALRAPEGYFPQLWETIQAITNESGQLWVLKTFVPHMPASLFPQVWQINLEHEDANRRTRMLTILLPHIPERFFPQIWKDIQNFEYDARWQILLSLAPHVPGDFIEQFLTLVQAQYFGETRAQILSMLAPRVPEALFPQFWAAIQTIQGRSQKVKLLLGVAPHVPARFFSRLWAAILTIENQLLWQQILKEHLPRLTQEQVLEVFESLQTTLPAGEIGLEMLDTLIPYLPTEKCVEMVEEALPAPFDKSLAALFTHVSGESWMRLRVLAILVPQLPEEMRTAIISHLLPLLRAPQLNQNRVWILTRLASHVPETLLKEMLEAIWALDEQHQQALILTVFLRNLTLSGWNEVLVLGHAKMQASNDSMYMTQILHHAETLVQQSSAEQLYPALHTILRLLAQQTRREALANLTLLAPAIHVVGNTNTAAEVSNSALEVGNWWP